MVIHYSLSNRYPSLHQEYGMSYYSMEEHILHPICYVSFCVAGHVFISSFSTLPVCLMMTRNTLSLITTWMSRASGMSGSLGLYVCMHA